MRTVWCRWTECRLPIDVQAGKMPDICPHCQKDGMWSTEPPREPPGEPARAWALTWNDKRLLHSLKIDPEDRPEPEHEAEDWLL